MPLWHVTDTSNLPEINVEMMVVMTPSDTETQTPFFFP